MIFFLCVLTISMIFIAGVAALALAATGVVFVSGVVAGFLGMAAHRLLPWIVLAIGFCALLFVNYAGAHEFRRGSATRNHERSTNVSDSNHDPVAEFMFGRVRGHDRGILRLQRSWPRSEEHTSELQSPDHLVCRLLLAKKKHAHIVYKTA